MCGNSRRGWGYAYVCSGLLLGGHLTEQRVDKLAKTDAKTFASIGGLSFLEALD